MQVTFTDSELIAENIRTFNFVAAEPFEQIAGQFIQLHLPHDNPDDRGEKRWFTVSSPPSTKELSITTKFAGDTSSTFKKALFALQPGTEVEMVEPEGDFVLPDDKNLTLIFIAGGMGITPFHSIIQDLVSRGEKRDITLLYGVQTEGELAFGELFAGAGINFKPVVGQRFTTESLMKEIGEPAGKLVYLSGPEPMVEALTDSLQAAGLPATQLKSDYFPGYDNNYSN